MKKYVAFCVIPLPNARKRRFGGFWEQKSSIISQQHSGRHGIFPLDN